MPHKHCAWGKCKSDSRYPEKYPGVTFIPFVKPGKYGYYREKCLRWIKACGRHYADLNVDKKGKYT